MVTRSARQWCGWGALLVTVSCLGGQTGQPTAADCPARSVDANEAVSGVTPAQLLATFEGTHAATLQWLTSEPAADDELTLELHARSEGGVVACGGYALSVTVNATLGTREHGELERFDATLTADTGQLTRAEISRAGSRVRLDTDLVVIDGEVRISGTLTTSDGTLPASTAIFPAGGGGAAGGG